MNKEARF